MRTSRLARYVRLGLENLLLHKLRSLLTMLGIVFGVGSVIAMLSVGEGASRDALNRIRKLGSNNIIISSVKPVDEATRAAGSHSFLSMYGLLYDDHARLAETFPHVRQIVPVKTIRKEARVGERMMEVRLVGTTAAWFALVPRKFLAGRPLSEDDQQDRRAVAILTEQGARKLLALNYAIGQSVRMAGQSFEVVGIVRSETIEGATVTTPDRDTDAYVPLSTMQERFGDIDARRESGSFTRERVELSQLIVAVDDAERVEAVAAAIQTMLQRFHERPDYHIHVPLALLREAERTKRTFNIVLGSIACISLLVGGIGIMNIMLASVTERTREIGIRRAIGARRSQIVGQFLIETIVLSTAGGIIGICMGLFIPWMITLFAGMPTVITPWSVIVSLVISIGIGLIFGIYPARRAAGLDPIVALRHE